MQRFSEAFSSSAWLPLRNDKDWETQLDALLGMGTSDWWNDSMDFTEKLCEVDLSALAASSPTNYQP